MLIHLWLSFLTEVKLSIIFCETGPVGKLWKSQLAAAADQCMLTVEDSQLSEYNDTTGSEDSRNLFIFSAHWLILKKKKKKSLASLKAHLTNNEGSFWQVSRIVIYKTVYDLVVLYRSL